MIACEPNIPGQPHRWAAEICAWARGELVQWRFAGSEAAWKNCDYPSRGMPSWSNQDIEFRVLQRVPQALRDAIAEHAKTVAQLHQETQALIANLGLEDDAEWHDG